VSDYIEYIAKWLGMKSIGGGIHKITGSHDELDIIKHYPGIEWVDVTSEPDLPSNAVPPDSDSEPLVLINERIFKKGRTYAPKTPTARGVSSEQRSLLNDLTVPGITTFNTNTGYTRFKRLRSFSLVNWADPLRSARLAYPAGPAASIIVYKIVYDRTKPPGNTILTSVIIFQCDATHLATLLPFTDLWIGFGPEVDLPFYADIRITIAGGVPGFMDILIDIEIN
jgi:hypothetical protein